MRLFEPRVTALEPIEVGLHRTVGTALGIIGLVSSGLGAECGPKSSISGWTLQSFSSPAMFKDAFDFCLVSPGGSRGRLQIAVFPQKPGFWAGSAGGNFNLIFYLTSSTAGVVSPSESPLIYAAFFQAGPFATVPGPTLARNRPKSGQN